MAHIELTVLLFYWIFFFYSRTINVTLKWMILYIDVCSSFEISFYVIVTVKLETEKNNIKEDEDTLCIAAK